MSPLSSISNPVKPPRNLAWIVIGLIAGWLAGQERSGDITDIAHRFELASIRLLASPKSSSRALRRALLRRDSND